MNEKDLPSTWEVGGGVGGEGGVTYYRKKDTDTITFTKPEKIEDATTGEFYWKFINVEPEPKTRFVKKDGSESEEDPKGSAVGGGMRKNNYHKKKSKRKISQKKKTKINKKKGKQIRRKKGKQTRKKKGKQTRRDAKR